MYGRTDDQTHDYVNAKLVWSSLVETKTSRDLVAIHENVQTKYIKVDINTLGQ